MISPEQLARNFPKAVQWVTDMERACMEIGHSLSPQNRQDGEAIGIRQLAVVRVMVLSEIPLPSNPELQQLAEQSNLITSTTAGITFGHGIVLKARSYNRHLIAHELGHVFQYERSGGIEPFLAAYIPEVVFPPYYPNGPLEQEAERLANIVCPNLQPMPDQAQRAHNHDSQDDEAH